MIRACCLCLLLLGAVGAAAASNAPPGGAVLQDGLVNPGYEEKPAWFKNSFLDLREDLAEARDAQRRVLLYFYQDGCPYCSKLLQDNFGNRAIADKTRANFDVIAINMWGDREVTDLAGAATTEKDFAAALRVQYTPSLVFLDDAGAVALRINGYFAPHKFDAALAFVAGGGAGRSGFREFYSRLSPTPANTAINQLPGGLARPLDLARTGGGSRALLVLFEQPACRECDELHREILRQPAVATALSNLDVAQVNLQSRERLTTPDGRDLEAATWIRELGIQYAPSLVFFADDGREVFRSEAYLRTFHVHGAVDYVATGAYRRQPSFQRYLQRRTERLGAMGIEIDLMR